MCFETECVIVLQGHSRSLIWAPIESAYATSHWSSIVIFVLSCPLFRNIAGFLLRRVTSPLFHPNFGGVSLVAFPLLQNTWPRMTILCSIFTITNSVSAIRLHIYRIELFIEYFCCMRSPAQMCGSGPQKRDPQNIAVSRKDCGFFVDEKLRALRRRNLNK